MEPEVELMYQALGTDHGIIVRAGNPGQLIQRLGMIRRKVADPVLAELSFSRSPWPGRENEVWLVRRAIPELVELDLG